MELPILKLIFNLVLSFIITAPCEVDEKRPLQPNSVSNQSNQETEDDNRTVNKHGSEMPVDNNKTKGSAAATDNKSMETNGQGISVEKKGASMEETPTVDCTSLNRRRKQKTPVRVVHYANPDNDDDITDDETQPYSIEDKITGNGPDYEEKLSQSLAMESSSPVF